MDEAVQDPVEEPVELGGQVGGGRAALRQGGGEPRSGGMRRRLDVVASLIVAPLVLFLDEPTTGLDPRSRAEIWAAVRALADGGTTILLTTQYLDEADDLSDQVAIIDAGRAVAQGSPDELKDALGSRVDVVVADAGDLPAAAAVVHRITSHPPRTEAGQRR